MPLPKRKWNLVKAFLLCSLAGFSFASGMIADGYQIFPYSIVRDAKRPSAEFVEVMIDGPRATRTDVKSPRSDTVANNADSRVQYPIRPDVGFFPAAPDALSIPNRITSEWQNEVRTELRDLLQPRARPSEIIEVKDVTKPDDIAAPTSRVHVRWLRFHVSDGHWVRGALLTDSETRRFDALLVALHGHGVGLNSLFDPQSTQRAIAVELALAGFPVLALETRTFGGSTFGDLSHIPYVNRLRLQGREFHGQVVSDNIEAIDWAVRSLDHDGPIGVVGLSMGGLSTMLLAALDPRIDVCLVSGVGGSWRNSLASRVHCPCSIFPDFLRRMDSIHIFAAMSCRVIGLELGRKDHYLGVDNAINDLPQLESLEERRDVRVAIHQFDGDHVHDPQFVVDFFERVYGEPKSIGAFK